MEVMRLHKVALRVRIPLHDYPNFGYRNRSVFFFLGVVFNLPNRLVTAATIYFQSNVELEVHKVHSLQTL